MATKVFWSQDATMPGKDVVYYSKDNNLRWYDFQGRVPESTGSVAAVTMSGFGYHASSTYSGARGEVLVGVYCYFDKTKSWVKEGRTTEYILQHEQLHFDISYLAASTFMQELRASKVSSSNMNEVIADLYKKYTKEMDTMQDEYDRQTMNGQNTSRQLQWNERVKEQLNRVRD